MFYNQNEIYTSPITSKSNEDLDYEFEGFTEKDYFPDNEKQNIKNVEINLFAYFITLWFL